MYQAIGSLPCGSSLHAFLQSSRRSSGNLPGIEYQLSHLVKSGRAGGGTNGCVADEFDNARVMLVTQWTLRAYLRKNQSRMSTGEMFE